MAELRVTRRDEQPKYNLPPIPEEMLRDEALTPTGTDLVGDAAPEPDPEGYIRPADIGPAQIPEAEGGVVAPLPNVGQFVSRERVAEPQPLHQQPPETYQTVVSGAPMRADEGFAPLQRGQVQCPNCGSSVGAFRRDPFTGAVQHVGCAPTHRINQPLREAPTTGQHKHEFTVGDAKQGMQKPEEAS